MAMSYEAEFDLNLRSNSLSPANALDSTYYDSFRSGRASTRVTVVRTITPAEAQPCSVESTVPHKQYNSGYNVRNETQNTTQNATQNATQNDRRAETQSGVQNEPQSPWSHQSGPQSPSRGLKNEPPSPRGPQSPKAPLAEAEDYVSSVSDISSSRPDIAVASTENLLDPEPEPVPGRNSKAGCQRCGEDPDVPKPSTLSRAHWKSVPNLYRPRRESLELCEPMPLASHRRPPHHDSGVSGFSQSTQGSAGGGGAWNYRSSTPDITPNNYRRRGSSTSTATSASNAKADIVIMHIEQDIELARDFKKTVESVCRSKFSKRWLAKVCTWDDWCTAGSSTSQAQEDLLHSPAAVLFFIVTEAFLDGYARKPNLSTLTGAMYQVLRECRHVRVPVKLCAEQPPETRVAEAFPDTKCLKMQDKNVKEEINKSIDNARVVAKKKGLTSSLTNLFKPKQKPQQSIYPIGNV